MQQVQAAVLAAQSLGHRMQSHKRGLSFCHAYPPCFMVDTFVCMHTGIKEIPFVFFLLLLPLSCNRRCVESMSVFKC